MNSFAVSVGACGQGDECLSRAAAKSESRTGPYDAEVLGGLGL